VRPLYAEYLGAPVEKGKLARSPAELVKLAGMVLSRTVNIAPQLMKLACYAERVGCGLRSCAARPPIPTAKQRFYYPANRRREDNCTPVYPHFLIHDGEERSIETSLTRLAGGPSTTSSHARLWTVSRKSVGAHSRDIACLILGLGFSVRK